MITKFVSSPMHRRKATVQTSVAVYPPISLRSSNRSDTVKTMNAVEWADRLLPKLLIGDDGADLPFDWLRDTLGVGPTYMRALLDKHGFKLSEDGHSVEARFRNGAE
jgi:hypothetical protein